MKLPSRRSVGTCAFLCAASLSFTGCASGGPGPRAAATAPRAARADATKSSFTYFFWSEADVYLDVNRNLYFWKENGRPRSADQLPDGIMDAPGTASVVKRSSANPFDGTGVESLARRVTRR